MPYVGLRHCLCPIVLCVFKHKKHTTAFACTAHICQEYQSPILAVTSCYIKLIIYQPYNYLFHCDTGYLQLTAGTI